MLVSALQAVLVVKGLHEKYKDMPEPERRKPGTRKMKAESAFSEEAMDDHDSSVLVFRISMLEGEDGVVHEGAEQTGLERQRKSEIFRDIIVKRNMSLYDFAVTITHAFDFDFDDKFSFYRRRLGTICPGAQAAYSGISAVILPRKIQIATPNHCGVDCEASGWERVQYELIASTPGIPHGVMHEGTCYSYDVRYSEELGLW